MQITKYKYVLVALYLCFVSVQFSETPPKAVYKAPLTLDGNSFPGHVRPSGILQFFEGKSTLIFKDGIFIPFGAEPIDTFFYKMAVENEQLYFFAHGDVKYDGGYMEWEGLYDGTNIKDVKGYWHRGKDGTIFHDILLPEIVTWTFTPELNYSMVLIPGGTFEMGRPDGKPEYDNTPTHSVKIDSFYMDKYEVTVGQFKKFIHETGYSYDWGWLEKHFVSPSNNHPMVHVNWNDATAYAKWARKRLPTEAEWEYAARGGLEGQRYPWGNFITKDDANFHKYWKKDDEYVQQSTKRKDVWKYTSPVGSFRPNAYGLFDMAGNVSEWCQDWYKDDYYKASEVENPQGPKTGTTKVTRGGHWYSWHKGLRVYNRGDNPPDVEQRQNVQGFRCVKDISKNF